MANKERVTPPSSKLVSRAATNLPKKDPEAGRIMAERRIAKQQHATRKKP